ncbi:hypothetical protein [Glaciecola sp. KUL10]|uniref:hypothetical protein n=1 Tax=Glaciecola sp. (strain KUL10) TaxID=2161813 RepID=UPI000D78A9A8|nr:hypothetical protein [Glaciecola sp. KUL10]GBL04448.1 Staphylococcus tandem lipoprotein [Glaciecola sp. KUL10]
MRFCKIKSVVTNYFPNGLLFCLILFLGACASQSKEAQLAKDLEKFCSKFAPLERRICLYQGTGVLAEEIEDNEEFEQQLKPLHERSETISDGNEHN